MVMPGVTIRKPRVKLLAAGVAHGVDRLPGDEHGHDRGLAGAGGQLEGEAQEFRVGLLVGAFEVLPELLAQLGLLAGDFGQPDGGLHRLDLAEEGPDAVEVVVAPVLQQPGGLRRDLPLLRVRHAAPGIHVAADLVDDGRRVVGCCSSVERPSPSSSSISFCCLAPFFFFGFGIGVISSDRRRAGMMTLVGWPSSSSSQCCPG